IALVRWRDAFFSAKMAALAPVYLNPDGERLRLPAQASYLLLYRLIERAHPDATGDPHTGHAICYLLTRQSLHSQVFLSPTLLSVFFVSFFASGYANQRETSPINSGSTSIDQYKAGRDRQDHTSMKRILAFGRSDPHVVPARRPQGRVP